MLQLHLVPAEAAVQGHEIEGWGSNGAEIEMVKRPPCAAQCISHLFCCSAQLVTALSDDIALTFRYWLMAWT
ncbi:hypothetical protein NXC24_PC00750 (plasmid) [Rhizobium sp. NXC24]|nr:hypothetical protein NXC24_PC00750 [Rhizobium sp. NXC24]